MKYNKTTLIKLRSQFKQALKDYCELVDSLTWVNENRAIYDRNLLDKYKYGLCSYSDQTFGSYSCLTAFLKRAFGNDYMYPYPWVTSFRGEFGVKTLIVRIWYIEGMIEELDKIIKTL